MGKAWWLLRHTLAVIVFPFTVMVLIPLWIGRDGGLTPTLPANPWGMLSALAGAGLLAVGTALFVSSLRRFGGEGEGTLAPWDPPANLVVRGPYAYVRNPMISGVILVLLAEAALLRAMPLLEWAGLFFLINAVYIPLLEEPMLRARFGEAYERYCANVPRLVPRLRPWTQP